MQVGARTDLGQVRKINEDNYLLLETKEWQLYAIADGMGGHQAGEVASSMAVDCLKDFFSEKELADWEENWKNYLDQAFQEANRKIYNLSQQSSMHQGMGTTLTAVLHKNGQLYIGHVGDSRMYLVRGEEIKRVTNDHSLVEELVRQGEMTVEEAKYHPKRNILLRALGSAQEIGVDLYKEDFVLQDILLLSTDGLTSLVEEEEIKTYILNWPPEKAAEKLTKLANGRGGHDNITIIIVKNIFQEKKTKNINYNWIRYGKKIIIFSLLLLVLSGYYYWDNSYFLGFYQDKLTIFKGVPLALGSFKLCKVEEITGIDQTEVVNPYRERVKEGIMVRDKNEAYVLIKDITSLP